MGKLPRIWHQCATPRIFYLMESLERSTDSPANFAEATDFAICRAPGREMRPGTAAELLAVRRSPSGRGHAGEMELPGGSVLRPDGSTRPAEQEGIRIVPVPGFVLKTRATVKDEGMTAAESSRRHRTGTCCTDRNPMIGFKKKKKRKKRVTK